MHKLALCLLLLATAANADCLSQLEQQSRYPLHYVGVWSTERGVAGRLYVWIDGEARVLEFWCQDGRNGMRFVSAEISAGDNHENRI